MDNGGRHFFAGDITRCPHEKMFSRRRNQLIDVSVPTGTLNPDFKDFIGISPRRLVDQGHSSE